jgi:hypothetical protein
VASPFTADPGMKALAVVDTVAAKAIIAKAFFMLDIIVSSSWLMQVEDVTLLIQWNLTRTCTSLRDTLT